MSLIEDIMREEAAKTTRTVIAAREAQAKDPLRHWIRRYTKGGPGVWHIEKDMGLSTYCGIASIFGSVTQERTERIEPMVRIASWSGIPAHNPSFKVCRKCVKEARG